MAAGERFALGLPLGISFEIAKAMRLTDASGANTRIRPAPSVRPYPLSGTKKQSRIACEIIFPDIAGVNSAVKISDYERNLSNAVMREPKLLKCDPRVVLTWPG